MSNLLSKILGKRGKEEKVGGMEDYMTLVRVYFQASLAASLNITNLAMLPDLRTFKTTLHVPTQNNKLGIGEKSRCKKMMKGLYKTDDDFFKEIDSSIRKNCHHIQDVNVYLIQFQNFTQEMLMLVSNLMKFKLRLPSIFKKTLYSMVQQQVSDIFLKNDWKDVSVVKSVAAVRKYNQRLGFCEKWISDFVFQVVVLAKKEPKPSNEDAEKAKNAMK